MDGTPDTPGFYELDTVAHCGHTLKGEHLWTLTATNPKYGWTMLRSVKNKAYANVKPALDWITRHTPTALTAVDFDNGTEFLNWSVITWLDERDIDVTRGRPYQHNDNAHVEQRNGDWVRKHAFRYRYEGEQELNLLNQLWHLVMLRKNYLLPCVKVTGWKHTPAGRKVRVYDKPRTPYQRLLDASVLDQHTAKRLANEHAGLNPAKITRQIDKIQQQLIELAAQRTKTTRPAA